MERPTDPYSTLGLERGASLDEVKRAYRRLVKQSHPDAAGPQSVQRFLLVQAAYQTILTAHLATSGPAAGPAARRWQASRRRPERRAERESAPAGPGARGGSANDRDAGAARRRATLGSTSYDDADGREPDWNGSSWYGPASGTYWTVNPREYADPRKHGPEYQARGRMPEAGPGPRRNPAPGMRDR